MRGKRKKEIGEVGGCEMMNGWEMNDECETIDGWEMMEERENDEWVEEWVEDG